MSRGVNKAIVVGNLGKDPDIRSTPSGATVANFTIATNESWKDKNTGEQQEKTEWHNIVAWGKQAEVIGQYAKKGSMMFVEGRLQTRKWQDKEGHDKYTTEIMLKEFQFLGDNSGGGKKEKKPAEPAPAPATPPADDFDDDIPF